MSRTQAALTEDVPESILSGYRLIELSDRPALTQYLSLYPDNEGSECTFSNLYIWGQAEHIEWKIEGDCLLLHVRERGDKPCLLMVFAEPARMKAALEVAVESMRMRGEAFQMRSLPSWYVDLMQSCAPGRFAFEREPHHDDYVYCAADLISLSGKKLHGKRNHINKFLSNYGDRFTYERYTPELQDACLNVHRRWQNAQPIPDAPALREEANSVRRALEGAEALGLVGGVIRIDGEVMAFSLGERITGDMALIHVEKAAPEIPGLFAMINRELAAHEFADLKWINREEDMGEEGLRQAKRSYQPARMIEKYGATLA